MRDAMSVVPDDLPDGAFFAMAEEIGGFESGEGIASLANESGQPPRRKPHPHPCPECNRRFATAQGLIQHRHDIHAVDTADVVTTLVAAINRLLHTTELNLDELEPDTVQAIKLAEDAVEKAGK